MIEKRKWLGIKKDLKKENSKLKTEIKDVKTSENLLRSQVSKLKEKDNNSHLSKIQKKYQSSLYQQK